MKKFFLFGAIAATLLSFSACEVDDIVNEVIESGIYGSASFDVTVDGATQTLDFASNVTDSYNLEDSESELDATVAFCADVAINFQEGGAGLTFPYAAFQFSAQEAGTYQFSQLVNGKTLKDFCYDTVVNLLRRPSGVNLFVMGNVLENQNDTMWYVSESGNITVNNYPQMGGHMRGTVTIQGICFTTKDIEDNKELIEEAFDNDENYDIHNFPFIKSCTISGNFDCMRTALVQDVIKAFEEEFPEAEL